MAPEESKLLARLDAFGHNVEMQAFTHANYSADYAGIVGIGRHVANE